MRPVSRLLQLQRQLHALRLAARQRGRGLAQLDVADRPTSSSVLQLALDGRHGLQELVRGLHRHVEDLRDVAALVLHLQRLAVVALAVADLAGHVDVGQEVHLDLHHAVALAGLAAAAGHVEAEAPGPVAALARGVGLGHQLADRREQAGVGGRVAARRAADRRLVDVDDLVEVLDAFDRLVRGRLLVRAVERARHGGVERVVDQRRLARARDAGHAGEQADREGHAHVLQVVAGGADHADLLQVGLRWRGAPPRARRGARPPGSAESARPSCLR